MNFLKVFLLIALSFFIQYSVVAQNWISHQSNQQINDLIDTGNEFLMATDAGLVVMNKTTFDKTIFNKLNSNLTDNKIESIAQAPNGDIWIATIHATVARFDGSNFQDVAIPQGNNFDQYTELFDLQIAPNGDFWLGTSDAVYHKQGTIWTEYDNAELGANFFEAWDIAIDGNGVVFMASFDVHKFENGVWENLTAGTNINAYLDADLFFSSTGDLYLAGDLDKIAKYDGVQWQSQPLDFNGSEVLGITEDVNGNLFFNTRYDGIFQLQNDVWTPQVDAQATAFGDWTSYFYIDAQNKRWLNSNIHLSVNDSGNIQSTLIGSNTLESNRTYDVRKGEDGKMYFITSSNNNISVLDPNGDWSFLPYPASWINNENGSDIFAFSANDIWLATQHGLRHFDGNSWTFNALDPCRDIAVDSQGKIYVRSVNKIYIIENGVIAEYNPSNAPLTGTNISGIGVDANDNLWVASVGENMIQKVSPNGTWTSFSEANHPAINNLSGNFHFDNNGNVWVPTQTVGAVKFDGLTFSNPFVGNINAMANYEVHAIENDASGKVYFAHQFGVTTLHNGQWSNLLIQDVPNTFSSLNSEIRFDDQGTLWWANSLHGVFSFAAEITLPVNLLSFEAEAVNRKDVKISWKVSTHTNDTYFSVEHSLDGINFNEIATQNSQGPTSSRSNYYLHENAAHGWNYYRLKQITVDGNFEYSEIANARIAQEEDIQILPNPTFGHIRIQTKASFEIDTPVQILNTQGQEVFTSILKKGEEQLSLDLSNFPTGIYYLRMSEAGNFATQKIVKQ